MKQRIHEATKFDTAVTPQTVNSSNVTGRYFSLVDFTQLLIMVIGGALAAGTAATIELFQAKDEAGTDAKQIGTLSSVVTSLTKIVEGTIALATVANTDVVTVNGIAFTKAAATDAAANEFADAAALAALINSKVTGVFATAVSTTVTVRSASGEADVTLSKTENSGTITLATTAYQAALEIGAWDLDRKNGFTHVAARVTSTGNGVVGAVALRGDARITPQQIGPVTTA